MISVWDRCALSGPPRMDALGEEGTFNTPSYSAAASRDCMQNSCLPTSLDHRGFRNMTKLPHGSALPCLLFRKSINHT
ncbi:hypothetical protein M404DRAFT_995011 [Pisolithus tinctorius Marx 270]|uniref:Uncharacterized protein n=1 Tax=Pisolithus tinctorius Marx 270 TaxID=870435 RepID=A0A0C3PC83_PISTI|nr:hypothetical protein M404DRAFT_995011 [Pisolithus tinctorius Marx 270]